MAGPGMQPVKLLGLTLNYTDGRVIWSREQKYPGEHDLPLCEVVG